MKNYTIVPVRSLDGRMQLNRSVLVYVYNKLVEQGLIKQLFYSTKVDTPELFIGLISSNNNATFLITEGTEVLGIFWINDVFGNANVGQISAQMHFCFFKETWGDEAVVLGKGILNQLLNLKNNEGVPFFSVIRGVTPSSNKLALRFIKKLGMKIVGEIPGGVYNYWSGKQEGMVLSYINTDIITGGN